MLSECFLGVLTSYLLSLHLAESNQVVETKTELNTSI